MLFPIKIIPVVVYYLFLHEGLNDALTLGWRSYAARLTLVVDQVICKNITSHDFLTTQNYLLLLLVR